MVSFEPTLRRKCLAGLVLVACIPTTAALLRAQPPCDPQLLARSSGVYGYQERGDRCEGEYGEPVSLRPDLLLVSLAEFADTAAISRGISLHLYWTSYGNGERSLRAEGLGGLLYRMEAAARPSEDDAIEAFEWPARVLDGVGAELEDIGVLIWTEDPQRPGRRIHLPARISSQEEARFRGEPEMILVAGVAIDQLLLTVDRVDAAGKVEEILVADENLCPIPCLAGPLRHRMDYLNKAGLYRLRLAMKPKGSDSGKPVEDVWIYYDPSSGLGVE